MTGVLVVSLTGVHCRFWSHLGCLGRKVTIIICLFRYRLGLCIRNLKRNSLPLNAQNLTFKKEQGIAGTTTHLNPNPNPNPNRIASFSGRFTLEPHPHWSPLGFNFNFPTNIPVTFIWKSPPPPPPPDELAAFFLNWMSTGTDLAWEKSRIRIPAGPPIRV